MFPNANFVWRDFITDGIPGSGKHDAEKSDARAWGTGIENIAFLPFQITYFYTTKADLLADLTPANRTSAGVIGDPIVGNDGLYRKNGASGSGTWSQLTNYVPGTQIVTATDAGTGTANAVLATSALAIGATANQIVICDILATNTSTAFTISFNGGTTYPVKTASGGLPPLNGLPLRIVGVIKGADFQLLSDIASVAIQAAATTAANAASSSAANASASELAAQKSALVSGFYPGAQTNLPRGATGTGAITAGSGGTNGTFALAFTGGNFSINPSGTFTVAGGVLTAITLTGPGLYVGAAPTAPTLSFAASAGLTGAASTLTVDYLVGSGKYYWTNHATDPLLLALYFRSGTTATVSSGLETVPRTAGSLLKMDYYSGLAVASKRIIPASGSVTPSRYRSFTTVLTKQYEAVALAHKDQLPSLQIINAAAAGSGGMNAIFDLSLGTFRATVGTASMTAVGGGWYLCIVQCAVITTAATNNVQLRPSVAGVFPFTANGTDGLFVDYFVYREVGTTTNLFPASDISDASFTSVSSSVASGTTVEALESTANVKAQKQADYSDAILIGRQTASRLTEGSGAGLQTRIYKNTGIPAVIGDTITFKARMKRGLRKRVNLFCNTMAILDVTFDLETGTAIGTGGSCKYVGGGFWELTATSTAIAASTTNMIIKVYDDTGATPRTGNGTGYVSIYDASLSFNGGIVWSDTVFTSGWTLDGITATANADTFGDASSDLAPSNASIKHPFNGKKVGIIGTSITAQGFYTTPLAEKTGCIMQNLGTGGASLASNSHSGSLVITNNIASLDVASNYVLVEAGTNDFGVTTPSTLGTFGDTTTSTFYGALYNAEVAIRARCPGAKIAFMTQYSADSAYATGTYKQFQTNANGNTMTQFQNAVAQVAAALGCPLIDVGREAGIGYHTTSLFGDGLHINTLGGAIFSKYVAGRAKILADMGVF
jgi:GDSL-like Lipase/Acylhydrolase family